MNKYTKAFLKKAIPYADGDYKVAFYKGEFEYGGGLFLGLMCYDEEMGIIEPYGDVTKNLLPCAENCAYIDTNNLGTEIIDWLVENDFGTLVEGKEAQSGFCTYPLFHFNMENVNKHLIKTLK